MKKSYVVWSFSFPISFLIVCITHCFLAIPAYFLNLCQPHSYIRVFEIATPPVWNIFSSDLYSYFPFQDSEKSSERTSPILCLKNIPPLVPRHSFTMCYLLHSIDQYLKWPLCSVAGSLPLPINVQNLKRTKCCS